MSTECLSIALQVRLIPAPRGAGIVAARVPKKVLQMAGIDDCYTASRGSTKTLGNFVKVHVYCDYLLVLLGLRASSAVRGKLCCPFQCSMLYHTLSTCQTRG